MRAGSLRHIIDIEQVTETRSSSGAVTESWSAFLSGVRARRHTPRGSEAWSGEKDVAKTQVEYLVRYQSGIVPKMRVKEGSTVYNIKAVLPDNRDRELRLICELVE